MLTFSIFVLKFLGKVLDTGIEYLRNNGFANVNKLKEIMLKHR